MMMAQCLMTKQYVAKLQSPKTGTAFMVFQTGDPKFYLFVVLDPWGCATEIQIPVKKTDLKREYARALRNGRGNAL